MNATRLASSETAAPETRPVRPVQAMLLELAYHLHATRVIEVLPAQPARRSVRRRSHAHRVTAARSA